MSCHLAPRRRLEFGFGLERAVLESVWMCTSVEMRLYWGSALTGTSHFTQRLFYSLCSFVMPAHDGGMGILL